MQAFGELRRYSASDVVGFVECEHVTTWDLMDLDERLPRADEDESAKLVQEKGVEHERAYLAKLEAGGAHVARIGLVDEGLLAKVAETTAAMRAGVGVVYQATLLDGDLIGYADFLIKVEKPSAFGAYGYEVWDTKLSRSPKAKFIVQLAFYSQLLAVAQGVGPEQMHVVLGDNSVRSYRVADYSRYFDRLMARFYSRVRGELKDTYPDPCSYCEMCKWEHLCSEKWIADDHLSQVANISRFQIQKLEAAGVETMAGLAVAGTKADLAAHVYHYAKYEETALKRLMTSHGTREADVDNLLRHGKLIDLYQVVREGIRVSEPRYSIKNIEHFYFAARAGEVTNAGSSIVWYERWRETQDQSLLDAIEKYNIDDVRSTQELRDWLLTYRPAGLPWALPPADKEGQALVITPGALNDTEARLVPYRKALVESLPGDRTTWGPIESSRELAYDLLDFHRRADKRKRGFKALLSIGDQVSTIS